MVQYQNLLFKVCFLEYLYDQFLLPIFTTKDFCMPPPKTEPAPLAYVQVVCLESGYRAQERETGRVKWERGRNQYTVCLIELITVEGT